MSPRNNWYIDSLLDQWLVPALVWNLLYVFQSCCCSVNSQSLPFIRQVSFFFFFWMDACLFEILGWNTLRLAFETERPSWIAKQQAGLGSRPNWLEQSGIFFFFLSLSNCCNKSQPWLFGSNIFSAPFRQPGSFHPIRFLPCLESTIQCFVILGVTACL